MHIRETVKGIRLANSYADTHFRGQGPGIALLSRPKFSGSRKKRDISFGLNLKDLTRVRKCNICQLIPTLSLLQT